ncbi:hypothetical protein [Streptomyces sp. CC210A]|uniref:hypothetical protein n=1 Tax=Streptomyces sp. CC210A TaxID=2898184 RepID=UPI001F3D2E15|nr:hypothetical protein [Streptomyces sp. CC210A]
MNPSTRAVTRIGHRARRLGMLVALLALAALLGLAPGAAALSSEAEPLPASAPALPEPAGEGAAQEPAEGEPAAPARSRDRGRAAGRALGPALRPRPSAPRPATCPAAPGRPHPTLRTVRCVVIRC